MTKDLENGIRKEVAILNDVNQERQEWSRWELFDRSRSVLCKIPRYVRTYYLTEAKHCSSLLQETFIKEQEGVASKQMEFHDLLLKQEGTIKDLEDLSTKQVTISELKRSL